MGYFRLRTGATNRGGYWTLTPGEVEPPDETAPDAPTSFIVTPGDELNTLSWTDPTDEDLAGIRIYRSLTSGSGFTLIDTVAPGVETYTDEELSNGTTYYYYLTAVDSVPNESSATSEESGTPIAPDVTAPDAPTSFTVTFGDELNTLTWTDPEDEDLAGIRVYRSLTSGSGYELIDTVSPGVEEYSDEGLVNGVTYYYVLTAVDGVPNESEQTAEQSGTPNVFAEELPVGTAAYGGYVAGIIDTDAGTIEGGDAYQTGRRYMVIVAPKSLEVTVTSARQWASSNQNLAGTKSRWDGLSITEAMVGAGSQYEAAAYCNGLAYADDGGSQWYLPARDELELLYRNLKSGTGASAAGHGVNPSSDPTGAAYADGLPGQTSVTAFQSGNAQAFVLSTNQTYMSSTWASSTEAMCQDFGDGWQFAIGQTTSSNMSIRPVRRVYLDGPLTTVGDIYVATTGNDTTGDGTPGNPFATIAKASTVVLPGSAVRVAPGTYTGQVTTNTSGLPDARIRYISTTPRGAKIDANGANRAWVNGGAYINIEGFEITNSEYVGILNNSHSCIIRGNHIHSLTATDTNGGNGGAFYTEHATQSHDNWVDGNLCHGNSGMVEATHNHGIYIASPGGTATNNIVYDVAAIGLHAYHDPQGVIFANNLIFDCDQGILVGGDSGGNAVSDAVVNNNIVIDCRVGVQELPSPYTGAGNEYDSNIFFGYTLLSYKDGGSVPLTNTITSNPQLVNYQIDGSGDYHLTSGSPAIGEGTATGAPEKDYDGVTRGSPPDIGPYEYVA